MQVLFVCEWQVYCVLCYPLVTHSALAVVLPIIRHYTNHQITLTLALKSKKLRTVMMMA